MNSQNIGNIGRFEVDRPQEMIQLPEADVKYFKKYRKDFVTENWYWGFTCFSRQNYKNDIIHTFEDEVIYGICSHEGNCMSEMSMTWEKLGNVTVPYLRSFSESFSLLMSSTHKKFLRRSINGERTFFIRRFFKFTDIGWFSGPFGFSFGLKME